MTQSVPIWAWVAFTAFVLGMLALDLGVFNRKSHTISVGQALRWTAVWVTLAFAFCGGVWRYYNSNKALEFLTGYLIEYSLSVDNIFVFILIFSYFKVAPEHQHKVLFWGILGALLMRATMIFAGAALLHRFEWVIYIFGAFLVYTGFKLAFGKDAEVDPDKNPLVNFAKRFMSITPQFHGDRFFIWENSKRVATPLFIVLLIVETTDVVFAIDSIPAIFGVTKDPFIVFTSNVFAILGLRSLYFALSGVMDKFHYLKTALAFILAFIGVKMLLGHTDYKIETPLALGAVLGSLSVAVLMSLLKLKTWQSGLLLTALFGAIGLILDFLFKSDGAASTLYGMALGCFLVSILVTILHPETDDASTVELPPGHAEHSPATDESDGARIHQ
ncbi:MAG TPA: TerC family protein [Abditibacteriaceae bacterium]|jgi:tellurite resistance protein TerC